MKLFNNSFIYIKKSIIIKNFIFLFNLIISINSISIELKQISVPYLSLHSNNYQKNIRNLSEQYIYGSAFSLNYYYSNLYLGDDMQKQGYILDTGSTITASTCSPLCQHCGKHINPHYNVKSDNKTIPCSDEKCQLVKSKCQGSTNKCTFSISYSEGSSISGVYINEIARFGENYKEQNGTYVPIGCITNENNLFFTQDANGIMGLANNKYNFIEILYKSGAIKNNVFSLCLAQLGGIFNIGEINNRTHKENITFVPMLLDREKYYGLTITSMSVNERKIESYSSSKFNIFIDSGTTISYINNKIFDEILELMKEECKKYEGSEACGKYKYHSDFGHCFYFDSIDKLNYAINNYWPIINFYLDGYDYKWRPQNYVFNITSKNTIGACMGINKSFGTKITLGSSWIIGHDIIFDREHNLLGLAEAECFQNKNLNFSNGLELKDDINNIIKNQTLSKDKDINKYISKITNKINIKNENNKNLIILLIVLIVLLIILLIFVIVISLKYFKQKTENLGINNSNNNKITYIEVSNDNNEDHKIVII